MCGLPAKLVSHFFFSVMHEAALSEKVRVRARARVRAVMAFPSLAPSELLSVGLQRTFPAMDSVSINQSAGHGDNQNDNRHQKHFLSSRC